MVLIKILITAIFSASRDSAPEDVVCRDMNNAGVAIMQNNFEDYHRVGNRWQTILKFCRGKISKKYLNVKKDSSKFTMECMQLTGDNKI